MENAVQTPGVAPDDDGTDLSPTGAAPPSTGIITSFLLHVRQQAADGAVDPTPGAPPPAGASQLPTSANSASDGGAVAASPATATRTRKGRGSNFVQPNAKRKGPRAPLLRTTGQQPTHTPGAASIEAY